MLKLKSKKSIPYTGKVYDLQVENSTSYNVEGVSVHNSAAGCLLSWCLDITEVDSLNFGLYFERFMNPTRKAVPDIDCDFENGSDDKTLDFLYKKYGEDRVFPVITFGTFNEKGCLKDVMKAFNLDTSLNSDVAAVTKEMPNTLVWPKPYETLEKWIENWPQSEECSERVRLFLRDPTYKDVIKYTLKLQKQNRNFGKHAGGIVITPGPVWELMPVNICNKVIVSGYQEAGMSKGVSLIGGLKLDRLKLETLNIIKDALSYIKERHGEETFLKASEDLKFIHYKHDPNLYEELKLGNNNGIFQFESDGITSLAKNIDVESFDEVVAATALYRPGPMKLKAHEDYISNKFKPNSVKCVHPLLEPLLKDTKGVLIYQEQLMFIASELGGLTKGEGDNLRKVMDGVGNIILKKLEGQTLTDEEENNKAYKTYKELWSKFIDGMKSKGVSESDAEKIEAWLIKYLGYSFNLSHAFSYTILTVRTLYLKHYYPSEFYCALLNHPKSGTDEEKRQWLVSTVMAAMNKGFKIVPPNRKSKWEWSVLDDTTIAMGYSNIKGFGSVAFDELQQKGIGNMSRNSFFETKFSKFNKTSFEVCLKAGMFDDWSKSRDELKSWREIKIKDVKQYDMFTGEVGFASIEKIKIYAPTIESQKYAEFIEVCNLDLKLFNKIDELKKRFREETGAEIQPVTNFNDPNLFYYFFLVNIEDKVSANKGIKFYSLTVSDGIGTKKINMWSNMYDKVKNILSLQSFYVTKFMKQKQFLAFNAGAPFRKVL